MHNKQLDYNFMLKITQSFSEELQPSISSESSVPTLSNVNNDYKIHLELYAKPSVRNICNGFILDNKLLSSSRDLMMSSIGQKPLSELCSQNFENVRQKD